MGTDWFAFRRVALGVLALAGPPAALLVWLLLVVGQALPHGSSPSAATKSPTTLWPAALRPAASNAIGFSERGFWAANRDGSPRTIGDGITTAF